MLSPLHKRIGIRRFPTTGYTPAHNRASGAARRPERLTAAAGLARLAGRGFGLGFFVLGERGVGHAGGADVLAAAVLFGGFVAEVAELDWIEVAAAGWSGLVAAGCRRRVA